MALDKLAPSAAKIPQEAAKNITVGGQSSGRITSKRCDRRSYRESVPEPPVRGPKEGLEREAISTRYQLLEQAYKSPAVPDGIPKAGAHVAFQTRLHRIGRSQGRLLACTHPFSLSKVPRIRGEKEVVLLQSNAKVTV